MELKQLTNVRLIEVGLSLSTKEDVIRHLVRKLDEEGKLYSAESFYQAVMEREALSPTGLEAGLAIPHGKSKSVKEAAFAVAKLVRPIRDWESIDPANEVELVFLLAIPEGKPSRRTWTCWPNWPNDCRAPNIVSGCSNAGRRTNYTAPLMRRTPWLPIQCGRKDDCGGDGLPGGDRPYVYGGGSFRASRPGAWRRRVCRKARSQRH
ncbi:Heat-responsive suppressor HrsA [Geobacillus sp. BCO2]|nr:Heat-responsive suppressor HrsA [Geobacillus sp. BCO2]